MDLTNIQKYVDNEMSRFKISRDVTETKNLVKDRLETDKKQDEVIQHLRDNQDRIVEALEFLPTNWRLPELEGEKPQLQIIEEGDEDDEPTKPKPDIKVLISTKVWMKHTTNG